MIMKKNLVFFMVFSLFYLGSNSNLEANGYQMRDEICPDGTTQKRCRPDMNSSCDVSAQTSCGQGGGGGGPIR